jgi:DNA-binding MarR family transcriptional regulator
VRFLAEHPDCSNHEVASGIGITQKSQTSALLSRLVEEDIVVKRSEGLGKRNAWRLTPPGEEIAEALSKLEGRAALAETDSPPSIVGQSEHDLHESAT